jgi:hypothetical protein
MPAPYHGTHSCSAPGQSLVAVISQNALQQPTSAPQLGTSSGTAQNKPGSHVLRNSQGSPNDPEVPLACGEHQKPSLLG